VRKGGLSQRGGAQKKKKVLGVLDGAPGKVESRRWFWRGTFPTWVWGQFGKRVDRDQNLWGGADGAGLSIYHKKGEQGGTGSPFKN